MVVTHAERKRCRSVQRRRGNVPRFPERAGYEVRAGYDNDPTCADPFEGSHGDAKFRTADVLAVPGSEISQWFSPGKARVLIACCPCQPYSALKTNNPHTKKEDRTTIDSFAIQIREIAADVVVMENVVTLKTYKGGETFRLMLDALDGCGYRVNAFVLNAVHHGVSQLRKRLVTVAARDAFVPAPERMHGGDWSETGENGMLPGAAPPDLPTIAQAIGDLRPLECGEQDPDDPMHRSYRLGPKTLERVKATPEGGDWQDWPYELREPRFQRKHGNVPRPHIHDAFKQAYGRRFWNEPSYTLTTQFLTPANGYYVHPKQDRCFTPREGARLQGFPDDFPFIPEGQRMIGTREARHIGNAVPPPMAEAVARKIAETLGL